MTLFTFHDTGCARLRGGILSAVFAIAACLLPATPLHAQASTTGVTGAAAAQQPSRLTTQQLTLRADIVAVGTVSDLRSEWTSDHTRILTRATLRVGEVVKGDPGSSTITVVYPGGEVGTVGELYSHTVSFSKNEEVVVFAGRDRDGNFRVVGGDQGKMRITKESGRNMVSPTMSVEELKSQVKRFLKARDNK
jgi:hypothetical protein